MATFAELVADVKTLTNRPDLDAEIKVAVKAATLKAHHSDFYPKDLYEVGLEWTTPAYIQSLDYRSVFPQWRSFKYLRKYASSVPGDFFTIITPEQTIDGYGFNRDNVCYIAGEQLEIRSSTQDDYMLIGLYQNPNISETAYSSWIAIDHPYAIVYEAVRSVFKMIGFDEQAAQIKQEVAEQFQLLKQNVVGYGE